MSLLTSPSVSRGSGPWVQPLEALMPSANQHFLTPHAPSSEELTSSAGLDSPSSGRRPYTKKNSLAPHTPTGPRRRSSRRMSLHEFNTNIPTVPTITNVLRSVRVKESGHRPACSRIHHSTVLYKGSLVTFGGIEGTSQGGAGHSTWKFSLDKTLWVVLNDNGGKRNRREGHTSVVYKNVMYVYGGHKGTMFCPDVVCLNLETLKWSKLVLGCSNFSPVPRFGHAACIGRDKMWVVGGFLREGTPSLVVSLSFAWNAWEHHTPPPSVPANAQTSPSIAFYENQLFVVGLYENTEDTTKVAILDVATEVWTEVSPGGIPKPSIKMFGQYYASSCFMAKTSQLYVFISQRKIKGKASISNRSAQRNEVMSCNIYCLDVATVKWTTVRLEGEPLPITYPTSDYDTKFQTACVGKKIFFCGGLYDDWTALWLTAATTTDTTEAPARGTYRVSSFMRDTRPSICPTLRDTGKEKDKEELITVPFIKDIAMHPNSFIDQATPVVRLKNGEMIRTWHEGVYGFQKRWLMEQWDGWKLVEQRRREDMQRAAHQQDAEMDAPDTTPHTEDHDDTASASTLGTAPLVRYETLMRMTTLKANKQAVSKAVWKKLIRTVATATKFSKAHNVDSDDDDEEEEECEQPPARKGELEESATMRAAGCADPNSATCILTLKQLGCLRNIDSVGCLHEVRMKTVGAVRNVGDIPPRPEGEELLQCIELSQSTGDPHCERSEPETFF